MRCTAHGNERCPNARCREMEFVVLEVPFRNFVGFKAQEDESLARDDAFFLELKSRQGEQVKWSPGLDFAITSITAHPSIRGDECESADSPEDE